MPYLRRALYSQDSSWVGEKGLVEDCLGIAISDVAVWVDELKGDMEEAFLGALDTSGDVAMLVFHLPGVLLGLTRNT